jgi:uncharacterized repeat protein (TIGR01451 family)
MFNKLLSNLPFNPSLINQVGFYAQRLKQEASIRRLGLILVVLTMCLQLFAVLSPSQPSLAASTNDLLYGGVTSKQQLVDACNKNIQGYQKILAHFAISCANVQNNSQVTTLHSDWIKDGQPSYSMGRIPQGSVNSRTGKATNEVPVQIGTVTFYMRLLSSWDARVPSTYTALSVGNAFGVQYFLLFSCGNVVQWGKPTPPPAPKPTPIPKPIPVPKPTPTPKPIPKPKPKPCPAAKDANDVAACITITKQAANITQNVANANNTTAKPGDVIKYSLLTKNVGTVDYKNYVVKDDFTDILDYADLVSLGGATTQNGTLEWSPTTIGAGKTVTKTVTIKVKDPVPKTPEPCNPAVVHPCPITGSFDLTMTNKYGTTINVKVQPPVVKVVEVTTTKTLVNTGPGTSLIIGFSITAIVGYYFARTRLMAKELDYVRSDYTSGGF